MPRFCAAACFFGFLLFSCSMSEPRIDHGFIELVYYPSESAGGAPVERFSFFVMAFDEDGIENLEELYLYHDREGMVWKLDESDWVRIEENRRDWIGSRNIAMPGDERLPRGQFRAVLVNKSGEKTERLFTFDGPLIPRYPYPVLAVSEDRYRIDSQYPVNRFICYDQAGAVINVQLVTEHEGTLREASVSNNVFFIALWADDEERMVSALTEAISVND